MLRLVQLQHPKDGRRVAVAEENQLRLLRGVDSIYGLARGSLAEGATLEGFVRSNVGGESLDYDSVYAGVSDWRQLPAYDHPEEPARA